MGDEEKIEQLPNLQYAEWRFLLKQPESICSIREKEEIKQKLLQVIKQENMLPFYLILCDELKWSKDPELVEELNAKNEAKIKQLDDALNDATLNFGESEIRDAMQNKADFYARIGEKEKAVSQYMATIQKTIGFGQKFDIIFTLIRIGLFWSDHKLITANIEKGKIMVEQGSDWDRKNRLKVYEAIYCLSIREFKKSAELLLETISTFTALELLDYQSFIFYTVLMSVVSLDRVTLKEKVINAPEVLAVVNNFPHLQSVMNDIYSCNYSPFFSSLGALVDLLRKNRFMSPHAGYFCKEMRVLAYSQLMESYRSVQLESVANAFGVTVDFIDRELSRFIASGRLHCKIDKVGQIVETNRPDSKNAQYQATIKQGDLLLNRIQKLSRVINL